MQKLQTIKSYEDAHELGSYIVEQMDVGQTVSFNAITLTKVDEFKIAVNGSEYNYQTGENVEKTMYGVELGEFIFFPERRRVNDALDVIESQLRDLEAAELFQRIADWQ